jgi:hypothetical protein
MLKYNISYESLYTSLNFTQCAKWDLHLRKDRGWMQPAVTDKVVHVFHYAPCCESLRRIGSDTPRIVNSYIVWRQMMKFTFQPHCPGLHWATDYWPVGSASKQWWRNKSTPLSEIGSCLSGPKPVTVVTELSRFMVGPSRVAVVKILYRRSVRIMDSRFCMEPCLHIILRQ